MRRFTVSFEVETEEDREDIAGMIKTTITQLLCNTFLSRSADFQVKVEENTNI